MYLIEHQVAQALLELRLHLAQLIVALDQNLQGSIKAEADESISMAE